MKRFGWMVPSIGFFLLVGCSGGGGGAVSSGRDYVISEARSYLLSPRLPDCNPENPEVVIIENAEGWEHINDPDKRIFCVSPGDYGDLGMIEIRSSGTEQKPRYLLLNRKDGRHPASMVEEFVDKIGWSESLARYRLRLVDAQYWIVDRQAYWNDPNPLHAPLELRSSSHNLFMRALFVDTAGVVGLEDRSDDNRFQSFHMEKTLWAVRYAQSHRSDDPEELPPYDERIFADLAAFVLVGEHNNTRIVDNVFVNNEIINYVDAFQTCRCGEGDTDDDAEGSNPRLDASGTVIVGNLFYTTPEIYTDENGSFTPEGRYAVTENALDFKFGSLDPSRPVTVLANVMFGYRIPTDRYSELSDNGNAIVFHYGAGNILLEKNWILDSENGFAGGGPQGGEPAMYDIVFRRNVFYGIHEHISDLYGSGEAGVYDAADHLIFEENVFGPMRPGTISLKAYNAQNVLIRNNFFVHSKEMYFPSDDEASRNLVIRDNLFYETPEWGIPDYAEASGNRNVEEAFDWSPYRRNVYLRKFTRTPVKMEVPF